MALSGDGNTAIVGGQGDDGKMGAAWVWMRSAGQWTQQGGKLVGSGAIGDAFQGCAVALSNDGNTAIVGGMNDDDNAGAAWIWTRSGGAWNQQGGKLVGSGAVGSARQGKSVALSADGNTAIVGGYLDDGFVGAAWIWTRSAGVWTQQGNKLVGSGIGGDSAYKFQGASVSLSADGNTAIVGGGNTNSNSVGAAWVWTRSAGIWVQQGDKLIGTGAEGAPGQGYSVALSADGNTAIVGGPKDNNHIGAAWVWTRSGGVWIQQGSKLTAWDSIGIAEQGTSVAISRDGNTAIIGGALDNDYDGAAWAWTRSAGVWKQLGTKLARSDGQDGTFQGQAVALSADGTTAMFGDSDDGVGAAWVFTRPPAPVTPVGVTAVAVTSTRVDVTWNPVPGATYEIDRKGAGGEFSQIGTSQTNTFSDMTVSAASALLYRVRAVNGSGPSPHSALALVTTVMFVDNPLQAGIVVKAEHLSQLRAAVNAVRQLAGLSAATFTDPALAGVRISAVHVTELRSTLDVALTTLGFSAGGYTNGSVSNSAIKAIYFQELRDRLQGSQGSL